MKKKIIASILCIVMSMPVLSGCSSLVEGEYTSVTAHRQGVSDEDKLSAEVTDVSTYDQLRDEILDLISSRKEYGVIRFIGYDGIVEADVSEACMEISYDTPIGAYAVYYLTSSVNKIVSYYEAEMYITYKKTARQINSIKSANTEQKINNQVKLAMQTYSPSIAILTDINDIAKESITEEVRSVYYDDPSFIVCLPDITVSFYPDTDKEKIIEITFEYPYPDSTLQTMEELLMTSVDNAVEPFAGFDTPQMLLSLCNSLVDMAEYVDVQTEDVSVEGIEMYNTAYGAIVTGTADSEGFATAYKLLCDKTGIESYVVEGRRDNDEHMWNIVKIGEDYYHVDVSALAETGSTGALFRTDSDMRKNYWWDTDKYPPCLGSLTYADLS